MMIMRKSIILNCTVSILLQLLLHIICSGIVLAFVPSSLSKIMLQPNQANMGRMTTTTTTTSLLLAMKPQRLEDNVDGVLYVNDRVSYILT
jgi:hypothetical protein